MTIKDLAIKTGYAVGTVSRALNAALGYTSMLDNLGETKKPKARAPKPRKGGGSGESNFMQLSLF